MIFTLILGIILIVFSSVSYAIISYTLYNELDNELTLKASGINYNIQSYLEHKGKEFKSLQFAVEQTIAKEDQTLRRWWYTGFERNWFKNLDRQDLSDDFVNFIALNNSFVISSKGMDKELLKSFKLDTLLDNDYERLWNLNINDKKIRVINYPFYYHGKLSHIIQVGISKKPVIYLLEDWLKVTFLSIPIFLLLTSFIGWWLTSRSLKPVDRIIKLAKRISYEDLNIRVEPKNHYHEMNHLIEAFNDMLSRLEKSFGHIEEFSSHVAHELKTPLTIIRGEAELSLLNGKTIDSKDTLEIIIAEVDNMLKTIDDMLFLSRTSYQPEFFDFQEIELVGFLKEVVDSVKIIAWEKHIDFKFVEIDEPVMVWADHTHLRRLFINLIDNAFKYTPPKGRITVKVILESANVCIAVTDTGMGIAQENLIKIFDQFFREVNTQKGVGLGLSIAQAIAVAHNGKINVQSQLYQGTTFTVEIPIAKSHQIEFVHAKASH